MKKGRRRIVIVGAGGFARELAWHIREINDVKHEFDILGFIVSDISRVGVHDSKSEILGDYEWLESNLGKVDSIAIGVGTPSPRLKIGEELSRSFPSLEWPSLIHPAARFDFDSCDFGHGAIVCAGVIGTVNVRIESFAMINLSCTLGHECRIGHGSVLNPTVNLSGGVSVGKGVLVGTGAQVLQYVDVGDLATVGAGAVVTKDVAGGTTVVGIPARPLER